MTNYDYVQKTIDIFEDSLNSEKIITTASELAGKIGYSVHHLSFLFQLLCGESLGRYILKRRLTEAICAIRNGSLPSEVFSRYGWQDYSAFSRSLRKEHGLSPSKIKTSSAPKLSLTFRAHPLLSKKEIDKPLEPILIRTRPIHATGLVFFMDNNVKGFHKSWRIFTVNKNKIRGVKNNFTYQFSFWDENASPENDGLWIFCATETDSTVDQDMLFFSKMYPSLLILSFKHTGPVETIHHTYRKQIETAVSNVKTNESANSARIQKIADNASENLVLFNDIISFSIEIAEVFKYLQKQ